MVRTHASFYRFYFMSHGATVAAEIVECEGDSDALDKAKELFFTSTVGSLVVWQGTRKVGVLERH